MEPKRIFRGSYIDASMMKEILEENGIPCLMQSERGEGLGLYTGRLFEEYYLSVSPECEEQALEIIESVDISNATIVEEP